MRWMAVPHVRHPTGARFLLLLQRRRARHLEGSRGRNHKRETILPTVAHVPNAVRGPLGERIIYETVRNPNGNPTVDYLNSSAHPPFDWDRSSYVPKTRSTLMIFSSRARGALGARPCWCCNQT
jgi:hypothetical protein